MAQQKVSELTQVTSANANDLIYIVHNSQSYSITAQNLFGNIGNPGLQGTVTFPDQPTTMTSPGYINLNTVVSYLNVQGTTNSININPGKQGQVITVITTASAGGKWSLGIANGTATVNFTRVGDTATMMYTSNAWYMIGGTANVSH